AIIAARASEDDKEHVMIKVGIVGMGVMGTHTARAIANGIQGITLSGVPVRTTTTAGGFPACSMEELIQRSDMVVEAATQAALREFGPAVLTAGRDLMVLSVGGLVGVLDEWAKLAGTHGARILVPSGAIAGLDGMKGAREGAITSVTMETRKPPRGLAGAPYIVQQRIDLDAIKAETLIFEGVAAEAVKAFPANVNVVAALSLAGVGPDRTPVKTETSTASSSRGSSDVSASRSRTCRRRTRAPASSRISRRSPC